MDFWDFKKDSRSPWLRRFLISWTRSASRSAASMRTDRKRGRFPTHGRRRSACRTMDAASSWHSSEWSTSRRSLPCLITARVNGHSGFSSFSRIFAPASSKGSRLRIISATSACHPFLSAFACAVATEILRSSLTALPSRNSLFGTTIIGPPDSRIFKFPLEDFPARISGPSSLPCSRNFPSTIR